MPKLEIPWPWALPKTVVIRWQGEEYEAVATYCGACAESVASGKVAGVDLGEVHIAVAHDDQRCTILNGRALRSKRRYQNRLKARLAHLVDTLNSISDPNSRGNSILVGVHENASETHISGTG